MPTKILVLGVDAANSELVRGWAEAGVLPTFRRLLERGLVGHTRSVEGFFVGATWPSFYTGGTPASHTIHGYLRLEPGTYDFYRCRPGQHATRRAFWDHLSDVGRKVAVLDVPLAGLSKRLNGIHVVEWGGHDAIDGFSTSPHSLARKLKSRFGLHPLAGSCDAEGRSAEAFMDLRDRLISGIRKKAELTRYYLASDRWDLFIQVFSESHCVGHQCWHLHDPAHPGYSPEIVASVGDPIRDVYVAIDTALAECLADVTDETLVIVLISHGMSYRYDLEFLMPDILMNLKVATPTPPVTAASGTVDRMDAALTRAWQHTPAAVKFRLQPLRKRLRSWIDSREKPIRLRIDAKRSACFPMSNGLAVTGLRLNIMGREPNGKLRPGRDVTAFSDQLTRDLLNITNLETAMPVIRRVVRTADLYSGEYLDRLPDLLVEWSDARAVGSATCGNPAGSRVHIGSPKVGTLEGVNRYCRTGEHRADGLFISIGCSVPSGPLERTVSIMDFAPTIASLLGTQLEGVDGQPIAELVQGTRLVGHVDSGRARAWPLHNT